MIIMKRRYTITVTTDIQSNFNFCALLHTVLSRKVIQAADCRIGKGKEEKGPDSSTRSMSNWGRSEGLCCQGRPPVDGSEQDCNNSIDKALELLQSCTEPSMSCTTRPPVSVPRYSQLTRAFPVLGYAWCVAFETVRTPVVDTHLAGWLTIRGFGSCRINQ